MTLNGSWLSLCQAPLTVHEPATCPVCVCVRVCGVYGPVEKPSEVMAMAVGSGYMCVVQAGHLTLALSPLSSSLISISSCSRTPSHTQTCVRACVRAQQTDTTSHETFSPRRALIPGAMLQTVSQLKGAADWARCVQHVKPVLKASRVKTAL